LRVSAVRVGGPGTPPPCQGRSARLCPLSARCDRVCARQKLTELMASCTPGARVDLGRHLWLVGLSNAFVWRSQGDASEFYLALVGRCELESVPQRTAVHFDLTSSITCQGCGGETIKTDPASVLALGFPRHSAQAIPLVNLLRRHFEVERLTGREQYQCDRCRGKVCVVQL
jgi:hypothetical protein